MRLLVTWVTLLMLFVASASALAVCTCPNSPNPAYFHGFCGIATLEQAEEYLRCRDIHAGGVMNELADAQINVNGAVPSTTLYYRARGSLHWQTFYPAETTYPGISKLPRFYNALYPSPVHSVSCTQTYPYVNIVGNGGCTDEYEAARSLASWAVVNYGYTPNNPSFQIFGDTGFVIPGYEDPKVESNGPHKPSYSTIGYNSQGTLRWSPREPLELFGSRTQMLTPWSGTAPHQYSKFALYKREQAFCEGGGALVDGNLSGCGCCLEQPAGGIPQPDWQISACPTTNCPLNLSGGGEKSARTAAAKAAPGEQISGPLQQYCDDCSQGGNPIAASNGNKTQIETDFEWSGFRFQRYYNSLRQLRPYGQIDQNWSHSFSMRILNRRLRYYATGGTIHGPTCQSDKVALQDEKTHFEIFKKEPGVAQFRSMNLVGHLLLCSEPQSGVFNWTWIKPDGSKVKFDDHGYPVEIGHPDRADETLTLEYLSNPAPTAYFKELAAVVDAKGRRLTFEYGTNDRRNLLRVKSGGQLMAEYAYDELPRPANPESFPRYIAQRLRSATTATGSRIYHYGETANVSGSVEMPFHLTGITDERGIRISNYTYDDCGHQLPLSETLQEAVSMSIATKSTTSPIRRPRCCCRGGIRAHTASARTASSGIKPAWRMAMATTATAGMRVPIVRLPVRMPAAGSISSSTTASGGG